MRKVNLSKVQNIIHYYGSDNIKDMFSIINTPWPLLDSQDLKIYSVSVFVLGSVLGAVMSLFLTSLNYPNIFFSILAFVAGSFIIGLLTYKRDWLDEKYGLGSKYHIGMNYSVAFYFLCAVTVTCSILFFPPILKSHGLNNALTVFISQYIPVIFMLLRFDVYSEDNCPVKKTDEFGNEYIENTLGYNPLIYYFISFPYFIFIAMAIDSYAGDIIRHSYLTGNLITVIITFAVLFILLSPDLLDRVLPFDLKTLKGTGKLIVLLVVILSVVRFFL